MRKIEFGKIWWFVVALMNVVSCALIILEAFCCSMLCCVLDVSPAFGSVWLAGFVTVMFGLYDEDAEMENTSIVGLLLAPYLLLFYSTRTLRIYIKDKNRNRKTISTQ